GVGLTLPFLLVLALGWGSFLPLNVIMAGPGQELPALLVLAIAVAVTSIPVISRIFFDLGIIQTRFASLILGFAVLEDIVLWGVLAVAIGITGSKNASAGEPILNIVQHSIASFAYLGLGLMVAPRLVRKLHEAKWNILVQASPITYVLILLFSYVVVAAMLKVNFVFAAFLAGFGLVGGLSGSERERFSQSVGATAKVARAWFILIYFALVGYKLILGRGFSFPLLAFFLIGSSLVTLLSFGLAARLAGFRGLDLLN